MTMNPDMALSGSTERHHGLRQQQATHMRLFFFTLVSPVLPLFLLSTTYLPLLIKVAPALGNREADLWVSSACLPRLFYKTRGSPQPLSNLLIPAIRDFFVSKYVGQRTKMSEHSLAGAGK